MSYAEISINENDEEDAIEKIDDEADIDGNQEVIISSNLQKIDRREEISKPLKDQREKRMLSRKSESKQLTLMLEYISLKRKLM